MAIKFTTAEYYCNLHLHFGLSCLFGFSIYFLLNTSESFRISLCSLTVIPVAAVAHMYAITKVLYDKTRLLLWITQVPLEMCADR